MIGRMYPVTLAGHTVVLREFRVDDAAAAFLVFGDAAVTRWLSFDTRTADETASLISAAIERAQAVPRTEYYLAVTTHATDELIGFARLGLNGIRAAKLGYAVRADHWGRGYATDAARTLIDFGFTQLDLHRISAAIGPDNAASAAVAKRLGMRLEGTLRDHVHTNGAWRDSDLYSLLAQDWPTRNSDPSRG